MELLRNVFIRSSKGNFHSLGETVAASPNLERDLPVEPV